MAKATSIQPIFQRKSLSKAFLCLVGMSCLLVGVNHDLLTPYLNPPTQGSPSSQLRSSSLSSSSSSSHRPEIDTPPPADTETYRLLRTETSLTQATVSPPSATNSEPFLNPPIQGASSHRLESPSPQLESPLPQLESPPPQLLSPPPQLLSPLPQLQSPPPQLESSSPRRPKIHTPPSADTETYRRLSNNHNPGKDSCKWQPPTYDASKPVDFYKTLIAGYPSGDKGVISLQMEALAGWPAKDEWDFAYLGMSNHPFIKANYPHHEGFWGWGSAADQVVLSVPYIRRSMAEYHDILVDLGYPTEWADPAVRLEMLHNQHPEIEAMYEWRDSRVLDECHWYGWFIDYWMEGGLLRDVFTHELVSEDHWKAIMLRPFLSRERLSYDKWSDGTIVEPTYDPHCVGNDIRNGCEPLEVISADRLMDFTRGRAETAKIANALLPDSRMGNDAIDQKAWGCIWEELLKNKNGPKTAHGKPAGYVDKEFNFSEEMLTEMLQELNRLTTKYSQHPWDTKPTANRLVELLMEHTLLLQMELDEIKSGARVLKDEDFLGPKMWQAKRERREIHRMNQWEEDMDVDAELGGEYGANSANERREAEEHYNRFSDFGQHLFVKKRRGIRIKRARRKAERNA